jgi:hypothetical protein
MLTLLYARGRGILLARFTGFVSSADLDALDAAVIEFGGRFGPFHGIWDFSSAEVMAVPETKIQQRGRTSQLMPGRQRIIVVNTFEQEGLARIFIAEQTHAGFEPPKVVSSTEVAFEWLQVTATDFEPVAFLPGT